MSDIGINENALNEIVRTLGEYPQIRRALIFGSRAKGNFSPYSDIDIAICGWLNAMEIEEIKCRLDELPFVYTFDVVAYETIENPMFRAHIDRVGVLIYERQAAFGIV